MKCRSAKVEIDMSQAVELSIQCLQSVVSCRVVWASVADTLMLLTSLILSSLAVSGNDGPMILCSPVSCQISTVHPVRVITTVKIK